nr:hypothetical protein CFP56_52350 [Quercus suber]
MGLGFLSIDTHIDKLRGFRDNFFPHIPIGSFTPKQDPIPSKPETPNPKGKHGPPIQVSRDTSLCATTIQPQPINEICPIKNSRRDRGREGVPEASGRTTISKNMDNILSTIITQQARNRHLHSATRKNSPDWNAVIETLPNETKNFRNSRNFPNPSTFSLPSKRKTQLKAPLE